MGTSNFYYRDTLYAMDTYVSAADAECTCSHDATTECLKHADGCPAVDGYHDEFIYDDIKSSLIAGLNKYRKAKPSYTIYGEDQGWTNDGRIIGRIYKEFEISHPDANQIVSFMVGDDFCLRYGYNSGFNFDRTESQTPARDIGYINLYSTDDFYEISDFVWEALDSGLFWDVGVDWENLSDQDYLVECELLDEIKGGVYDQVMNQVEAFIAESDRIYHELGEKYFESYRVIATSSNGETLYQKLA